jgi:hypothetical protein
MRIVLLSTNGVHQTPETSPDDDAHFFCESQELRDSDSYFFRYAESARKRSSTLRFKDERRECANTSSVGYEESAD